MNAVYSTAHAQLLALHALNWARAIHAEVLASEHTHTDLCHDTCRATEHLQCVWTGFFYLHCIYHICLHIWFSCGADLWTFLLEFIVFDFCQSSQSYQKVIHCVVYSPLSQICVCAILNTCVQENSVPICAFPYLHVQCVQWMYMYSVHVPVCTCMFSILDVKKSLLQMCNKAIYDHRYRLQD